MQAQLKMAIIFVKALKLKDTWRWYKFIVITFDLLYICCATCTFTTRKCVLVHYEFH
jgi:hypothetical protein